MKKIFAATAILAFVLLGTAWCFSAAEAQSGLLPAAHGEKCGDLSADDCGNYTLDDFIRLALNISKWILGLVGSLTLAMFIFGGQMLLMSGGSSEKIDKAKKTMVAAVVGLLIVFGSFLLIKGALFSIGLNWDGSTAKPTPIEPAPVQVK